MISCSVHRGMHVIQILSEVGITTEVHVNGNNQEGQDFGIPSFSWRTSSLGTASCCESEAASAILTWSLQVRI